MGGLDVGEYPGEDWLGERVVEVEHAVRRREGKGGGVGADRADARAAALRAPVPANVGFGSLMQLGGELHPDNLAEWKCEATSRTRPFPEPKSTKLNRLSSSPKLASSELTSRPGEGT